MSCDCYQKANDALREVNTRIEAVYSLDATRIGMSWPISTVQIEKGRGKQKAYGLIASYCPLCGVSLKKPEATGAAIPEEGE